MPKPSFFARIARLRRWPFVATTSPIWAARPSCWLIAYSGRRSRGSCGRVSVVASDLLHRPVDLVAQVREGRETTLETYGEALALILAVESAQLAILREFFGVDWTAAQFSFGFSLGEIGAVVAGGVLDLTSALEVLLPLADDCVALAHDATLGVLFTRSRELALDDVQRLVPGSQSGRSRRRRHFGVAGAEHVAGDRSARHARSADGAGARIAARARASAKERSSVAAGAHADRLATADFQSRGRADAHDAAACWNEPRPPVFSLVTRNVRLHGDQRPRSAVSMDRSAAAAVGRRL